MGLFDRIEAGLQAKFLDLKEGRLAASALDVLKDVEGGIDGLLLKFEQAGLKEQAQSWVAKGKNLPVTAAQLKAALGPELEKIAAKADMTIDAVADKLAAAVPELVDKLTPDGVVPKLEEFRQRVNAFVGKVGKKDHGPTPPAGGA